MASDRLGGVPLPKTPPVDYGFGFGASIEPDDVDIEGLEDLDQHEANAERITREIEQQAEQDRQTRYAKIPGTSSLFPELSMAAPSKVRGPNEVCRYFGYSNPESFVTYLKTTRIPADIVEFSSLRGIYKQKKDLAKLPRPELAHIDAAMAKIRIAGGDAFNLTIRELANNPLPSAAEMFAICMHRFITNWFRLANAPFHAHPINPILFLDRTNALLKLQDRARGGIADVNKKRNLNHVQGRNRTMEKVQQIPSNPQTNVLPNPKAPNTASRMRFTRLADCDRVKKKLEDEVAAAEKIATEADLANEILEAQAEHMEIKEDSSLLESERRDRLRVAKQRHTKAQTALHRVRRSNPHKDLGIELELEEMDTRPAPTPGLADHAGHTKQGQTVAFPSSEYTRDPNCPRASWFRDGLPIGVTPEHMDELLSFQGTCFDCETCEYKSTGDPSFTIGGHDARSGSSAVTGGKSATELIRDLKVSDDHAAGSYQDASPSAPNDASNPIDIDALPAADRAAHQLSLAELKGRLARLKNTRIVTGYDKLRNTMQEEQLTEPSFSSKVMLDKQYEGIELTSTPGDDSSEREDGQRKQGDINDPGLRLNIDQAAKLMDNAAYQPSDYEKALNICMVAHRKNPRIPGQHVNGHSLLWWQALGSAEGTERKDREDEKRAKQLARLVANNDPDALEKAEAGVSHGMVYADEVGIGKTDTYAGSCLVQINRRKLDLWEMHQKGMHAELANYPAPKPRLVLTQPHLVTQMAGALANYSPLFRVFTYGARSNADPPGVTRIVDRLSRDHLIFDGLNEWNSQVFIVCAYPTFHVRHGPSATSRYLHGRGDTMKQAKAKRKCVIRRPADSTWRPDFELDKCFSEVCLDEAQNTKGIKSCSSYSIRSLRAPWHVMLTATPMPWHYRDFNGLLAFLQSPWDANVARDRICGSGDYFDTVNEGVLQDPYERNSQNLSARPKDERYCFTSPAFEKFVVGRGLDAVSAGPIVAMLFHRFLIRRDYSSSCIVDHKGTRHTIGESMCNVRRVNLTLHHESFYQYLHNGLAGEWTGDFVADPTAEMIYQNASSSRIMGLGAVSPLLLLARDTHAVKVPIEGDSVLRPLDSGMETHEEMEITDHDDDEELEVLEDLLFEDDESEGGPKTERLRSKTKKTSKMESPHLTQYRDLYMNKDYKTWLRKLMDDISTYAKKLPGVHETLFSRKEVPQLNDLQLVRILTRSSPRLAALLANIADQVDNKNEKAIVFALNPWEQMLYSVLLSVMGYKSKAYLSTMKTDMKEDIIRDFQRPLARWSEPGVHGIKPNDSEILILSYHMNSGLNLQSTCHNIHAPSPAPSYSIWIQTVGRVARFGQPFDCVVFTYMMPNTYNVLQYSTMVKNALFTIAALTCTVHTEGDESTAVPRVSFSELNHLHGFEDTLVDDRIEGYDKVFATGRVNTMLAPNDKFLRLLNVSLGKTVTVSAENAGSYTVAETHPMFQSYAPLVSTGKRTPRPNMLASPDRTTPTPTSGGRGKGKSRLVPALPSTMLSAIEDDVLDDESMPSVDPMSNSDLHSKFEKIAADAQDRKFEQQQAQRTESLAKKRRHRDSKNEEEEKSEEEEPLPKKSRQKKTPAASKKPAARGSAAGRGGSRGRGGSSRPRASKSQTNQDADGTS